MRAKSLPIKLSIFALFLAAASGCGRFSTTNERSANTAAAPARSETSVHMLLGNPSAATASEPDNYLIIGTTSAISYNNARGTANWVSWRTTASDLGESLERPDFLPDPRLPRGFDRVEPSDYSGSGYDRGHLVPSADRFADPAANQETFYMTNIVPQASGLNQFPWEKLERYSRGLARRNYDVYTISGVYGDAGRIRNKVTIPTNCWKVILALPAGSGLEGVNDSTRVIAVDMPNSDSVEKDNWRVYRTTVRAIEQITGLDLLSALPRKLQDVIENRVDTR